MSFLTILILVYLAALLWYGLRGERFAGNSRTFLTSGGTVGVIFCALSLVSTIVGGSATLGMGSLAKKTGAAAFWWLGVGVIGLFIHGYLIAPKIRALPCVTLPEVAGYVAGKNAERWAGAIIAVSWIAVTAAQFVALHALLAALDSPAVAEILYLAIAAVVLLHTVSGGQHAVIRTDAVQAVCLLGGFTAAAFWLWEAKPAETAALAWVPFNDAFGWGDWAKLMLLVGITYIIGPDMFSRTFSARSGRTARLAAWFAAPVLLWFGVVITYLAMMNLDAAQPVAGWLSDQSAMPLWLRGAIALGLVSALCGSADTVLLSAAGIAERSLLGGDRTSMVRFFVTLFGIAAAASVYLSGDIIKLLLTAYSLFVPGVAVPLLIALLGPVRRINAGWWLAGAAAGGVCGLVGNLTGNGDWTLFGMALSAAGAVLARVFSRTGEAFESEAGIKKAV